MKTILLALSLVYAATSFKLERAGNGYLFQGDMVMRKDQIDVALRGGDVDEPTGPSMFGMSKSSYLKWPQGVVPFVLSDSVNNKHNFKKYSHSTIDSLGSPYDYGSIMHYGARDFAKWPWQKTIVPKKNGVSIGQRSHLSEQDALQIRKFYGCK